MIMYFRKIFQLIYNKYHAEKPDNPLDTMPEKEKADYFKHMFG